MGQCLSSQTVLDLCCITPLPPNQDDRDPEYEVTTKIIRQMGVMNSAITREINLLEACQETASSLFKSIRYRANPISDAINLAAVTRGLSETIDLTRSLKTTLDRLITSAHRDLAEFRAVDMNNRNPNRSLAQVLSIHEATTTLRPELAEVIEAGELVRAGADAICNVLQEKYS